MEKNRMKAQASSFVKIIFIVIASISFVLFVIYFNSFRKSTMEEKISAEFKMDVMNTLQELVTDKNCLAYEYGQTQYKIVIEKSELDKFVSEFDGIEPDCAKALGFDYNIKVIQFSHNFSLYPGIVEIETGPQYASDFAQHICKTGDGRVLYVKCNFIPSEENCGMGELDPGTGWGVPICTSEDQQGRCCTPYLCPEEKCNCTVNEWGDHPWIVSCDDVEDVEEECTRLPSEHSWCGKIVKKVTLPTQEIKDVGIKNDVWGFGLSFDTGVSSFSPEKAKEDELQLSIPVTIRYNETFSTEGMIYIYAVKGELESLYSQIEDVCEKAKANDNQDIGFSREFHFSYPVEYAGNDICMLNSCKKFVCPYGLELEDIKSEGDYLLKFSFDSGSKIIKVDE